MNDMDKRIHIAFFVLVFLEVFYCLMYNNYTYLIYFMIALFVAYLIIYQEKVDIFFHGFRKVKNSSKVDKTNFWDLDKIYDGNYILSKVENSGDDNEGFREETISKKDNKNSSKRNDYSPYL